MNKSLLLIFFAIVCINMKGCEKEHNGIGGFEPSFASLEEGAGNYHATIYDDSAKIEIEQASFFGNTGLRGVRKEDDDSVNQLSLSKIKEIKIVSPHFESKRYADKDWVLATVKTVDNVIVNNLLIPHHVVICGVERSTKMEKSWFINKLNKIEIEPVPLEKNPLFNQKIIEIEEQKKKDLMEYHKQKKKGFFNKTSAFVVQLIDDVLDASKSAFVKIGKMLGID